MLGGITGTLAHQWLPGYTATPGAYALVGMGAVFAGIVRAPMTSVVMIFELTRDYAVIVPLMISNLVSFFIASRFQKKPIYEVLAHQDGIHLPSSENRQQDGRRRVMQAMRPAANLLRAELAVRDALAMADSGGSSAWLVCDDSGVVGVVNIAMLRQMAAEGATDRLLSELVDEHNIPHLHPDHPLHVALERFGATQLEILPVVSRADVHKLEGIVTLPAVLHLYGLGKETSA